jgi:hypothetical protein
VTHLNDKLMFNLEESFLDKWRPIAKGQKVCDWISRERAEELIKETLENRRKRIEWRENEPA